MRLRWRAAEPDPAAEQTRELSTYLVALCNGAAFGGGMRVAPMAVPDDGVLELISVGVDSKWTIVGNLQRVYSGRHLEVPGVEHLRCRSLDIELLDDGVAERFALDVDGDALGRLPLHAEVVPGALDVTVPAP